MGEIIDFVELYIKDSSILPEAVDDISVTLEDNIKEEVPYDQGRLKRSIRVDSRVLGDYGLVTGTWDEGLAPHGIFVLTGTKPHIIRPKGQGRYHAGKQLTQGSALWWPGASHPVREVHHPGTSPDDFLGRGLEATLEAYR